MDEKYVIDVKGKKVVVYAGLLNEAISEGLFELTVKDVFVDWKEKSAYCIAQAKVRTKTGDIKIFEGVGSSTPDITKGFTAGHFVEMAHTRAKSRALRDLLNLDMLGESELATTDESIPEEDVEEHKGVPCVCAECQEPISEKVRDFSIGKFKKTLCFTCQKKPEHKV